MLVPASVIADVLGAEWLAWVAPDIKLQEALQAANEASLEAAAKDFEAGL